MHKEICPEPILTSDVAEHFLDFEVSKRLLRVVLEDAVLHVRRKIALLDSTLRMLLPLAKFLELDCENRAHASCVGAIELAFAHSKCALHDVLSKH